MKFREYFNQVVRDSTDGDVISIAVFKFERSQKYPGVGYKTFDDYYAHKRWMLSEAKKVVRDEHNRQLLSSQTYTQDAS